MKLNDYGYDQIEEGFEYGFERILTSDDVVTFSKLSGDKNPLHIDKNYAKTTPFKSNIVHGMLASSLFSTLVSMVCPGKRNLYLSQTLNFKNPIYPGRKLEVKGKIRQKVSSMRIIRIDTSILQDNKIVIDGEAKVKLLE